MFYSANIALSFINGTKHLVGYSVRMITLLFANAKLKAHISCRDNLDLDIASSKWP